MRRIKFTGWQKGMHKIEFIHLLHNYAGISLTEAKNIKDKIVNNESVEIELEDSKIQFILESCKNYGVIVEIMET